MCFKIVKMLSFYLRLRYIYKIRFEYLLSCISLLNIYSCKAKRADFKLKNI